MSKILALAEIISALNDAERQGTATDNPEGSRYIQLSDSLAVQLADSLEAHAAQYESLQSQLEAAQAEDTNATAEARNALVDNLLASADLPETSPELDTEFKASLVQLATNAASTQEAEDAVSTAIEKRQKLLGYAQNTPNIEAGSVFEDNQDPNGEKARAIAQSRRAAGLAN